MRGSARTDRDDRTLHIALCSIERLGRRPSLCLSPSRLRRIFDKGREDDSWSREQTLVSLFPDGEGPGMRGNNGVSGTDRRAESRLAA